MRVMLCGMLLGVWVNMGTGQTQNRSVVYQYWESNSVQSNGIRLHYWRTGGQDKPVMIMAHGITDYGLNWATLASKLEPDYDIIMYDARGHGFSEKPTGPYDLATHVEDLVGLIKALGIQKPILVGHSMGGSIVALAAATYAEIPKAIIMEDPPMDESLDHLTEEVIPDWKAMVKKDGATTKPELMKIARTIRHPGLSDFEYDHWAEAKKLVHPNVVDIVKGQGFGDPDKIFPRISVPALILKAEAKEMYQKRHLTTAAKLQNGKLIHIKGTSHLVRHDKPKQTENAMRLFLRNIK